MSTEAASKIVRLTAFEQLRLAREIIRDEAAALISLSNRLQDDFAAAARLIHDCTGCVIVSGVGKAGLIGQKISSTLASTGTRSHFLHPAEATHGDLGRVGSNDVLLILSFSGETAEIVDLLSPLAQLGTTCIAMTGNSSSTLASNAEVVLDLGPLREACSLGLAPSTSTTAMLALGDALALVVSRMRGFRREDFARFHPGGSLGRKLARVEECMRPLAECRIAQETKTVREVFVQLGRPGRRTGAVMVVDANGRLTGIFTDSDLARLFEANRDSAFDEPVCDIMTGSPKSIASGSRMPQAFEILAGNKISELPVVDQQGKPVGLIDVTDIVGFEVDVSSARSAESANSPAVSADTLDDPEPVTLPFRSS